MKITNFRLHCFHLPTNQEKNGNEEDKSNLRYTKKIIFILIESIKIIYNIQTKEKIMLLISG